MSRAERFALGSIVLGCLVLGLKGAAWWLTGSAALYSDALESIVNVAASVVALVALRFAAVIEGVLIVVAALSIFVHAWHVWLDPHPLAWPLEGLALNGIATAVNGGWSLILAAVGRKLRSPALAADSKHLMADVVTSFGIAAGVGIAIVSDMLILDPIIAGLTGLYVLWSGMHMISGSVGGLMDAAPEPAVLVRIREIVAEAAAGAIEAHDLRTRSAGRLTFLQFDLVVPGTMTVAASHEICDRIEDKLRAEMEHLVVTIHVEPEEKAKQHGVLVL